MMGVDIDGPVQQSSDYTQGGQSDALFLLVVNNKTEQLQVISINRNTMADIELCDEEGIDMGPLKLRSVCSMHSGTVSASAAAKPWMRFPACFKIFRSAVILR